MKEEEKDRKIHQAAEAKRLKIEGKNILSEVGTILSISYKGSTEQNVHLFEPTPLVVLNYIYIYQFFTGLFRSWNTQCVN